MNQATFSLRWLNSKPKYMNEKLKGYPHTMTIEPSILNICIMVCNWFVVNRLMKCIFLQSPNYHIRWDLISTLLFINPNTRSFYKS
jgi:hypothetical protein